MGLTDQNKLFNFKPSCNTGTDCDNGFQAGGHQEIYIRPGLWMSMINFFSDTPVCLEYEKQYPVIDFGFVISGGIKKHTVCSSGSGPKQMRVKNGSSGVRMENRQTGMFTIPGDAKQQILLLDETRTNVSQTAWQVGYTNVSHFSEAFRKRFGILPKQYLKNRSGSIQRDKEKKAGIDDAIFAAMSNKISAKESRQNLCV